MSWRLTLSLVYEGVQKVFICADAAEKVLLCVFIQIKVGSCKDEMTHEQRVCVTGPD